MPNSEWLKWNSDYLTSQLRVPLIIWREPRDSIGNVKAQKPVFEATEIFQVIEWSIERWMIFNKWSKYIYSLRQNHTL